MCNKRMRSLPADADMPELGTYRKTSGNIWLSPSDGRRMIYEDEDKLWRK